VITSILFS